jgi:tol-pal system protein YbgF
MLRTLLLLVLCIAAPAQAGLFSDDDARKQIQLLEGRVIPLEEHIAKLAEHVVKLEDGIKQQTRSMLDLLGQIEALNGEIRKLRGQNEELSHGLQSAEKREKDFYVDLDTRLRHFEPTEATAQAEAAPPPNSDDPALENRAFEAAYGLYKGGSYENAALAFQGFIKKFPDSVHAPNANYWLANAQFALKNYNSALLSYQNLLKLFPNTARAAEILLNIAGCQQELKQTVAEQKTLKLLIAKYPASEAAEKAKKLISIAK